MQQYSTYKDSEIKWIGEIPKHWIVEKVRHNFDFGRGLSITKKDLKDKGIPCLNYGEIHSKYGFRVNPVEHKLRKVDEDYLYTSRSSLLSKGDFVFADTSEDIEGSGNFSFLESEESIFAGYHTVILRRKKDIDYRFIAYFFDSEEFRNQIRSEVYGIKVFSITQAILKNTTYIYPPLKSEQEKISNYLDRKTGEIDQLIADKKRLVELYKEEKTAIINQAVTKGINPDAPIKDSGIEWLGEIPEHWEVKKLNWCFQTIGSGTTPKAGEKEYYTHGIHNWLLTGDLNDGEIKEASKKITDKAIEDYSSLKTYPVNSIVIAMYGATIGKLGILKTPTTVNQACCVFSDPLFHYYKFAFYTLLAAREEIINMSYGGGQPNISQALLKQFKIQVPPKNEQELILIHIEAETKKIDNNIRDAKKYIELITEYRTALISEVVTGKIKVTDE